MENAITQILQLPLADRMEAVEAIWESIAVDPTFPNVQWRELDARLDTYEGQTGALWEVARKRVRRTR